jgi:hypothetical protein
MAVEDDRTFFVTAGLGDTPNALAARLEEIRRRLRSFIVGKIDKNGIVINNVILFVSS